MKPQVLNVIALVVPIEVDDQGWTLAYCPMCDPGCEIPGSAGVKPDRSAFRCIKSCFHPLKKAISIGNVMERIIEREQDR